MVKTKKEYILITIALSCLAAIITIVSLSTDYWVTADATSVNLKPSTANYGLFKGSWFLTMLDTPEEKYIKITCLIEENVCGWSYQPTSTERENEIRKYFNGTNCNNALKTTSSPKDVNIKSKCDLKFLNAGLWICTLLFIFFSLFMSLVTTVLSILNFTSNPTSDYLAIWGLKIWNLSASIGYLMTLIIWGSEYGAYITENIAVPETLKGNLSSKGQSNVGFSYWILLIPMVLHAANIGVLYYRQFQIDKEPAVPTIEINADKDGFKFLY